MESRNPVFNRASEFQRGGYATFDTDRVSASQLEDMYAAPSATAAHTGRMTLDDVVVKTGILFAVLLATAGATYLVVKPTNPVPVVVAALIAMVLGFIASLGNKPRPALMIGYAAFEGVFVGGVSYWYSVAYDSGLIAGAVVGTLAAFGTMLVLYKTGVVRNSPKFTKILMIAGAGYLVFGLLNLLLSVLLPGSWHNVYTSGGLLPVLVSGFGVVLASFFLVLDFDFVEQGVANGLPREFAWTAAFGLVTTLVWLYLELLRLLAILRGDD